jgi:putative nucleotidyltransferase with HDIG domain
MSGRLGTRYAHPMGSLTADGRRIAEQRLAEELPRRWSHVQAVASKAEHVALVLDDPDRDTLVAAAWLHDIGYAKDLALTGFHPLDGARWLRGQDFDSRVVTLVANHSVALIEAEERGLADDLAAEFPGETSAVADALVYCDMTTGPDGQDFDIMTRLEEIRSRYGPEHVVTRFINRAEFSILAAVHRTSERLSELTPS